MRPTLHMVPDEVWAATDPNAAYEATSLASEGFIHCTDGEEELLVTANRYYADDPRRFVALTVDLDASGSPWRIEDPAGIYPHIFGPIDRTAIVRQVPMRREPGGRFIGFGSANGDDASVEGEGRSRE